MKRARLATRILCWTLIAILQQEFSFDYSAQATPIPQEEEVPPQRKRSSLDEEEEPPKRSTPKKSDEVSKPQSKQSGRASVYDVVYYKRDKTIVDMRVRLYPEYLTSSEFRENAHKFYTFGQYLPNASDKTKATFRSKGDLVSRIDYFEHRVLRSASSRIGIRNPLKRFETFGKPLDHLDIELKSLERAESQLQFALREHDAAVKTKRRVGHVWTKVARQPLLNALREVQLSMIRKALSEDRLQAAESLCQQLGETLARDEEAVGNVILTIEGDVFNRHAREAEAIEDYPSLHQLIRSFQNKHLGRQGAVEDIKKRLVKKAQELMARAESIEESDPSECLKLVDQAAAIWPELAGLERFRSALRASYQKLICAVPELPQTICPYVSQNPVDKLATSLIFESLVRWVDDRELGPHFEPDLASDLPVPLPRGRRFNLGDSEWAGSSSSSPQLLTAFDVKRTVEWLSALGLADTHLAAIDRVEEDGPLNVSIYLKQDHWQPLCCMDFFVLPEHYFGGKTPSVGDLVDFGRSPSGTGPYRLGSPLSESSSQVRFVLNETYHKPKPSIKEIVLQKLDPIRSSQLFLENNVHMIYGVEREQVRQLREAQHRVISVPTPSVWFLAPNYEKPTLANTNFRLAIAHAIDREKILTQFFRPGGKTDEHIALNGPFPKLGLGGAVWAFNSKVRDYSTELALDCIEAAKAELKVDRLPVLSLVFPASDTAIENACTAIQADLRSRIGLEIKLVGLSSEQFIDRVMVSRNYDLAYWRHDFMNEAMSLEPLLGRGNFMKYKVDNDQDALMRRLHILKDFRSIRESMHALHLDVNRKAVVIPLWQLHTFVAFSNLMEIDTQSLDRYNIFRDVGKWSLK